MKIKIKTTPWLLFLLPLLLCAQTADPDSLPDLGFGLCGNAGYLTAGSTTYSQLRLLPELRVRKFALGLDFDLLVTPDVNLRKADWDEPEDYFTKISHVRYAGREEPLYFQLQGFPAHTLGRGLIMKDYSNRLLYPDRRQLGLMAGINTNLTMQPGLELFSSNLLKNEILAGSFSFRPLEGDAKLILKDFVIRFNAVLDRNPYGKYDDEDKDKVPDPYDPDPGLANYAHDLDGDGLYNSESPNSEGQYLTFNDPDIDGDGILDSPLLNSYVAANLALIDSTLIGFLDQEINQLVRFGPKRDILIYSVGYELPLIELEHFSLGHYAEYAQIRQHGSGFSFPGFFAKFLIFDLNLELRNFSDQFLPSFFDQLYEEQRSCIYKDSTVRTKDMSLAEVRGAFGWYGSLQADIAQTLVLSASYQDMYAQGAQNGKSLAARLGLNPRFLPRLKEAEVGYSLTNVPCIALDKLQTPSATLTGKASYLLSGRSALTGRYSERYADLDGNGRIKGKGETIKTLSLLVEFTF